MVQVRATEVIDSKEAAIGCTLRHPRVETVREDKDSSCCTSMDEVRTIQQMKGGKLYSQGQLGEGQGENPRKRSSRRAELGQIYRQQDPGQETLLSDCLKDKVVVVEPGRVSSLKKEVERLVMKHGGVVEQNLRSRTALYVETGLTLKGRGVLQRGEVDVVRSSWLTGQAKQENIAMPLPHQYLHMTETTRQAWRRETDAYLDPLTVPATRESLQFSMDQV